MLFTLTVTIRVFYHAINMFKFVQMKIYLFETKFKIIAKLRVTFVCPGLLDLNDSHYCTNDPLSFSPFRGKQAFIFVLGVLFWLIFCTVLAFCGIL